jgi:DAK2 domain fusion protein YloV
MQPGLATINPEQLRAALISAEEQLRQNYRILDNLNVFPVPDGDTGLNMLTTLSAGVGPLRGISVSTMAEIADYMMPGVLHGSRGNSGFIIACFFAGFFETARNRDVLSAADLTGCFVNGFYHVNKSLFSPAEGTVITIIRVMVETMQESAEDPAWGVDDQLRAALRAGRESLFLTPRILRILAKAGVVDSGALGFIFLVDGMLRGLLGEPAAAEDEGNYRFAPEPSAEGDEEARIYRFCTEVLVAPFESSPENGLREFLRDSGDSIALAREAERLKVHIHTDDPDRIIEKLKGIGTVEHIKVEDIHEQISLLSGGSSNADVPSVVACVPGPGFADAMASLGADQVILYGKDLPTTGEILGVLDSVERKNIILLPNNKNILPAAMLAREKSGKTVSIIRTSYHSGDSRHLRFQRERGARSNIASMKECLDMRRYAVYRSASDSSFGTYKIAGASFACGRDGSAAGPASSRSLSKPSPRRGWRGSAMSPATAGRSPERNWWNVSPPPSHPRSQG